MRGKVLFVVGLGVGYVLGTRAGRERYEQIKKAAEGVWNTPAVQQGVGTVKDFAATRVGDLSDTVLDGVKTFVGNTVRGTGATKSDVGSAAKSANGPCVVRCWTIASATPGSRWSTWAMSSAGAVLIATRPNSASR